MAFCCARPSAVVLVAACLVSSAGAEMSQGRSKGKYEDRMVRMRSAITATGRASSSSLSPEELKVKMSQVLQTPQVKEMMKDPQMKQGLIDVMHDPEKLQQLTNDRELADQIGDMLQKEPHALDELLQIHSEEHEESSGLSLEEMQTASVKRLHNEFNRLAKNDKQHVTRLNKNLGLRDHFEAEISALTKTMADENTRIKQRLAALSSGKAKAKAKDADPEEGQVLLQKAVSSDAIASSEQIEASIAEVTQGLHTSMEELHKSDSSELGKLSRNAKERQTLKTQLQKRIKEQQEELERAAQAEDGAFDSTSD